MSEGEGEGESSHCGTTTSEEESSCGSAPDSPLTGKLYIYLRLWVIDSDGNASGRIEKSRHAAVERLFNDLCEELEGSNDSLETIPEHLRGYFSLKRASDADFVNLSRKFQFNEKALTEIHAWLLETDEDCKWTYRIQEVEPGDHFYLEA